MKYIKNIKKVALSLIGIGLFTTPTLAQTPTFVDKELLLEIDVSGSIDGPDYTNILSGYKDAFLDPDVYEQIERQSDGTVVGIQFFASGVSSLLTNDSNFFTGTSSAGADLTGGVYNLGSQWFHIDPKRTDFTVQQQAAALSNIFNQALSTGLPNRSSDLTTAPGSGGLGTDLSATGCDRGFTNDYGAASFGANQAYSRNIGKGTNIAGAIYQGTCELNTNDYTAAYESVIDISSDGIQNVQIEGTGTVSDGAVNTNYCNSPAGTIYTGAQNQVICSSLLGIAQDFALDPNTAATYTRPEVSVPFPPGTLPGATTTIAARTGFDAVNRINAVPIFDSNITDPVPGGGGVTNIGQYFHSGTTQVTTDGSGTNPIGAIRDPNNSSTVTGVITQTQDDFDRNNRAFVVVDDLNTVGNKATILTTADPYTIVDYEAEAADQFKPFITKKLQAELEAVPFEFKPGFGLLLGLGVFGFRHWQLSKKGKNKEVNNKEVKKNG